MKRLTLILIAVLFLATVALTGAGSARYGGFQGLALRVRAEITERRAPEHLLLVPTPLSNNQQSTGNNQRTTKTSTSISPSLPPSPSPTRSRSPSPSPSPTLSRSPSPSPAPIATPVPRHQPARPAVALTGLKHNWQTWNNCGPATLAMHLSYFGSDLSQDTIRLALRPDWEDKNVSPEELAAFARRQGHHALVRVNGDGERLKLLLSNGIPVLVETWIEPKPNDGMGHYRLLTGYDEAMRQWIAYDSYVSAGVDPDQPYQGITISYRELAKQWPVFNRTYLVIYTSEQTPIIASILGADCDDASMWQRALTDAEAATAESPTDAFAWFNLGSDRVALGRFEEAAAAFDQARTLGLPWRMLWYQFGPFRAYYEVGRYDELLALADASLATTPYVEEFHTWRGMALQALGDAAAAIER